jgi:Na+/melibiose symporter-like transporter
MRNQKLASDVLMLVGIGPFLIVLAFFVLNVGATGDDALGVGFSTVIGYGIAYLLTLTCAFPASLWSYRQSKSVEVKSRYSSIARSIVIIIMASPFVLCGLAVLCFGIASFG